MWSALLTAIALAQDPAPLGPGAYLPIPGPNPAAGSLGAPMARPVVETQAPLRLAQPTAASPAVASFAWMFALLGLGGGLYLTRERLLGLRTATEAGPGFKIVSRTRLDAQNQLLLIEVDSGASKKHLVVSTGQGAPSVVAELGADGEPIASTAPVAAAEIPRFATRPPAAEREAAPQRRPETSARNREAAPRFEEALDDVEAPRRARTTPPARQAAEEAPAGRGGRDPGWSANVETRRAERRPPAPSVDADPPRRADPERRAEPERRAARTPEPEPRRTRAPEAETRRPTPAPRHQETWAETDDDADTAPPQRAWRPTPTEPPVQPAARPVAKAAEPPRRPAPAPRKDDVDDRPPAQTRLALDTTGRVIRTVETRDDEEMAQRTPAARGRLLSDDVAQPEFRGIPSLWSQSAPQREAIGGMSSREPTSGLASLARSRTANVAGELGRRLDPARSAARALIEDEDERASVAEAQAAIKALIAARR
jgi:hypothetical protein